MKIISEAQNTLVQFARSEPDFSNKTKYDYSVVRPPLFKADLQAWPTIIDQSQLEELTYASKEILKLLFSIPERIFNMDFDRISKLYNLRKYGHDIEMLRKIFLHTPTKSDDMFSRGDFVITNEGLRCVEFNTVTDVGGWQSKIATDKYMENTQIQKFIRGNGIDVNTVDTLQIFYSNMIRSTVRMLGITGNELNALACLNEVDLPDEFLRKHHRDTYNRCLKSYNLQFHGELFFREENNVIVKDGFVYCEEKRIDLIIDYCALLPFEYYESCFARNVHILNGPVGSLFSSKLNFAILCDRANRNRFNAHELSIIEKYIPKSYRVSYEPGDENFDMEFWMNQREKIVIKRIDGARGEDVFVGRQEDPQRWKEILIQTKGDNVWLAQEFVQSSQFEYQDGESGISKFNAVWGVFMSSYEFAGCFLRLRPLNGDLVINAAKGATESFVLIAKD